MIKTILFLFILNAPFTFASTQKNGFLIESNLTYQSDSKSVATANKFILSADSKNWVSLISSDEGVSLLGKLVKSTPSTVHIEYIVIDNSKKPNVVISTPSIISKLGEKAEIRIDGPEAIKISLLAKQTEIE